MMTSMQRLKACPRYKYSPLLLRPALANSVFESLGVRITETTDLPLDMNPKGVVHGPSADVELPGEAADGDLASLVLDRLFHGSNHFV
uniref:Uncharacterized protein n=1 Tax=Lepeophtheirus salmonis TaxID=72036 RepID=A0A0K2U184_LEPSM